MTTEVTPQLVYTVLANSLAPDPKLQRQNLEVFNSIRFHPTLPHYLTGFLVGTVGDGKGGETPVEIRHAAGLALKQLMLPRPREQGNLLSLGEATVREVQQGLLQAMVDPHRPLRVAAGDCISHFFSHAASTPQQEDPTPLSYWPDLSSSLEQIVNNSGSSENVLVGVATCTALLTEDLSAALMKPGYEQLRTPLLNLLASTLLDAAQFPEVLLHATKAIYNIMAFAMINTPGVVTDQDFEVDDIDEAPQSSQDFAKLAHFVAPKLCQHLSCCVGEAAGQNAIQYEGLASGIFDCFVRLCLCSEAVVPQLETLLAQINAALLFTDKAERAAAKAAELLTELYTMAVDDVGGLDRSAQESLRRTFPSLCDALLHGLKMNAYDYDATNLGDNSHIPDAESDVNFLALLVQKTDIFSKASAAAEAKASAPAADGANKNPGEENHDEEDMTSGDGVEGLSSLRAELTWAIDKADSAFPDLVVGELLPRIGTLVSQGAQHAVSGASWRREDTIRVEAALLALSHILEECYEPLAATIEPIVKALEAILSSPTSPALLRERAVRCLFRLAKGWLDADENREEGVSDPNPMLFRYIIDLLTKHIQDRNKQCQTASLYLLSLLCFDAYNLAVEELSDDEYEEADDGHQQEEAQQSSTRELTGEQLTALFNVVDSLPSLQARCRSEAYTLFISLFETNANHKWLNANLASWLPRLLSFLQVLSPEGDPTRNCEVAALMCALATLFEALADEDDEQCPSTGRWIPALAERFAEPVVGGSLAVLKVFAAVQQGQRPPPAHNMLDAITFVAVDLVSDYCSCLMAAWKKGDQSVSVPLGNVFTGDLLNYLVYSLAVNPDVTYNLRRAVVGLLADFVQCAPVQSLVSLQIPPPQGLTFANGSEATATFVASATQNPVVATVLATLFVLVAREFSPQAVELCVNGAFGLTQLLIRLSSSSSGPAVDYSLLFAAHGGIHPVMTMSVFFLTSADLGAAHDLKLNFCALVSQLGKLWPEVLMPSIAEVLPAWGTYVPRLEDDGELCATLHAIGAVLHHGATQQTVGQALQQGTGETRMNLLYSFLACGLAVATVESESEKATLVALWQPLVAQAASVGALQSDRLRKKDRRMLQKLYQVG